MVAVKGEGPGMRRRLAVVAARAMRVARGLWPDRNPLRRTLLAWTGELTLAMLAQLEAARLRQHTENKDQSAAPPASDRTARR
jgi:hypothetical protein